MGFQAGLLFSLDWLKGSRGRACTDQHVRAPSRCRLLQPCYITITTQQTKRIRPPVLGGEGGEGTPPPVQPQRQG